MKDFLIVILVLFGLLFAFRAFFTPKAEPLPPPVYRPTAAELEDMRVRAARRKMLRWIGLALLVVGGIVLAIVVKPLEFFVNWYSLAVLIVLAGVGVLIFSFRR
jgi:hypothetical protein